MALHTRGFLDKDNAPLLSRLYRGDHFIFEGRRELIKRARDEFLGHSFRLESDSDKNGGWLDFSQVEGAEGLGIVQDDS